MIECTTLIRVRYCEVDRMGYMHHGIYPQYFEQARTDLIKKIGLSYREIEDKGIIMPVREMNIKYLLPAFYDDEVEVTSRLIRMPAVRLEFEYEMADNSGKCLCKAKTTLVFAEKKSGKPIRIPDFFRKLVAPFFEDDKTVLA